MTRLSTARPVRLGDVELVPVEATIVRGCAAGWGLVAVAAKEPVAVIIRTPSGERAVDLESRDVPLDELLRALEGGPDFPRP